MALIRCRNCSKEISDIATVCSHCGVLIIDDTLEIVNKIKKESKEKKVGKIILIFFSFLIGFGFIAYIFNSISDSMENTLVNNIKTENDQALGKPAISNLLPSFEIQSNRKNKTLSKSTFYIWIENRYTLNQLSKISNYLRKTIAKEFESVYIFYYLEKEYQNHDAYAIDHLKNGVLTGLKILGMTTSQVNKSKESAKSIKGNVIGTWLDNTMAGGTQTLVKIDDKYFIKIFFGDGSATQDELKKSGKSTYIVKNNDFGEYYVIRKDLLEVYDNQGLIKKMKKVK